MIVLGSIPNGTNRMIGVTAGSATVDLFTMDLDTGAVVSGADTSGAPFFTPAEVANMSATLKSIIAVATAIGATPTATSLAVMIVQTAAFDANTYPITTTVISGTNYQVVVTPSALPGVFAVQKPNASATGSLGFGGQAAGGGGGGSSGPGALLRAGGWTDIAASHAMDTTKVGVVFSGAVAAQTFDLAQASATPDSFGQWIVNESSQSWVVHPFAGDTIQGNAGDFPLPPDNAVFLAARSSANDWVAVALVNPSSGATQYGAFLNNTVQATTGDVLLDETKTGVLVEITTPGAITISLPAISVSGVLGNSWFVENIGPYPVTIQADGAGPDLFQPKSLPSITIQPGESVVITAAFGNTWVVTAETILVDSRSVNPAPPAGEAYVPVEYTIAPVNSGVSPVTLANVEAFDVHEVIAQQSVVAGIGDTLQLSGPLGAITEAMVLTGKTPVPPGPNITNAAFIDTTNFAVAAGGPLSLTYTGTGEVHVLVRGRRR